MKLRRLLGIVMVVGGIVALVLLGSSPSAPITPVFAALGAPTTPFVPRLDFLTASWFCPGVPLGDGLGGTVVIANPGDTPLEGRVTTFTDADGGPAIARPFEVAPRQTSTIDLAAIQATGTYVSALVETSGAGGIVEQVATTPQGSAVAPCSNSSSNEWHLADGYTKDDSSEEVVITNPFPDDAIVDVQLATTAGSRNPAALAGYPVKGHSVRVIKVGEVVRDDAAVAVDVTSSRGRVIVGRAQRYKGPDRAGFTMTLAAPALTDQAWFADGESGQGITERYSVHNDTDNEIAVQAVFLGIPPTASFANDQQLTVPAHGVATFDTSAAAGLPEGRHGIVFSTASADSMVVERAITRPAGDASTATSVVLGQPARAAGARWSMAVGTSLAVDGVLAVMNIDNQDATVTVKALGPGGEVPVPGMEQIPLAANQVIALGLTDSTALGKSLVVESTARIYVERLLPRGPSLRGRTGSFALPG